MYQRVLVGTDGSSTAALAVESAARTAIMHGADLVIGHAYPSRLTHAELRAWQEAPDEVRWRLSSGNQAEETVQAAVSHARSVAGPLLRVRAWAEPGRPVPVLLAMIQCVDPDVLVIGNRDMRGWVPGRSASRGLSRRASCDVLIVDTIRTAVPGRRAPRPVFAHRTV